VSPSVGCDGDLLALRDHIVDLTSQVRKAFRNSVAPAIHPSRGREELTAGTTTRGVLTDGLVTVVATNWFGDNAVELAYRRAAE
jgi:hypothetical protein